MPDHPVGFAKSVSGASYLFPTLLGDPIREEIAALIDPIPIGLNQVTAAWPVFPKGSSYRNQEAF